MIKHVIYVCDQSLALLALCVCGCVPVRSHALNDEDCTTFIIIVAIYSLCGKRNFTINRRMKTTKSNVIFS